MYIFFVYNKTFFLIARSVNSSLEVTVLPNFSGFVGILVPHIFVTLSFTALQVSLEIWSSGLKICNCDTYNF
jgi:hypothetical protein